MTAAGEDARPPQTLYCCLRLGIYGVIDKFPFGVLTNKGITMRTSQQPGQRYMGRMLEHVQAGELDPSFLITHRMPLEGRPARIRDVQEEAGRLPASRVYPLIPQ